MTLTCRAGATALEGPRLLLGVIWRLTSGVSVCARPLADNHLHHNTQASLSKYKEVDFIFISNTCESPACLDLVSLIKSTIKSIHKPLSIQFFKGSFK